MNKNITVRFQSHRINTQILVSIKCQKAYLEMRGATACLVHVRFLRNYRKLLRQIPKLFRIYLLSRYSNNFRIFALPFLLIYDVSKVVSFQLWKSNKSNLPLSLDATEKRCLDP